MKKLLLCASLLLVGSASAQMVEDFEGVTAPALPSGWTQVTNATDGGYATTSDVSSTYFVVPSHTQYIATSDDNCNCDKSSEQLISAPVVLPASGADLVTFDYSLGLYYGETGNFGISTDGGATVTDLGLLASTRVGTTNDHGWATASYVITTYAGQMVNFVWTYDDNADWGSGLAIDDVQMVSLPAVDMEMTALTTVPTVLAGNTSITGTVTSLGADLVTSIDVTWNDGSGANSATFPVNLNYGDTYDFTHTTPLDAAAGTAYSLDVCVVAAGDAVVNNDCMQTTVSAVSALVPKITVGEEKTGEWCGWCPRGAVALADMSLSNPSDFIGIAVHNGDAMAVSSYDGNIGNYVPGGYPGGGVDRVVSGNPADFLAMHNSRANMVPPASVSVTGTSDGTNVTVTVSADFVGSLSGDYRLAVVLVEDGVAGAGQANYYNDGASGAMAFPNTGSMPNFNFVGGGSTVSPVFHDHVARALGDNEINGAAGSLPASIIAGSTHSHTYTIAHNASWAAYNMHAVGMLVDASTGEILNAGISSSALGLNDVEATSFNVSAMPNPTNGVSNIVVDLAVAAEMSLVVVDVVGNVIYSMENTDLAAGSYQTSVDLSNNANGVYFAQVVLNGTAKTVKIIVEK